MVLKLRSTFHEFFIRPRISLVIKENQKPSPGCKLCQNERDGEIANDFEQAMPPGNYSEAILLEAKKQFCVDSIVDINSQLKVAAAVKTKDAKVQSTNESELYYECNNKVNFLNNKH